VTSPASVLRDAFDRHTWATLRLLDHLEAGTLRSRIAARNGDPGFDPAETLLLLQALHHTDDHRAQVCSTLGALGLDVPDLDAWSFWDDQRRSD